MQMIWNKTQWVDKCKTEKNNEDSKRVSKTKQYTMMGKLIKGE